jgi:hypothetical protein
VAYVGLLTGHRHRTVGAAEALSSLHLMYAALERKDGQRFQVHKKAASDRLGMAIEQFRKLTPLVPDRSFSWSIPGGNQQELVDSFAKFTIPFYKLSTPTTQRQLINTAVEIISILKNNSTN